MPHVVQFTEPGRVELVEEASQPLLPGTVRVRTWWSGISAGTELTAYRGTNPYMSATWDPEARLFRDGRPEHSYPVAGWGYSEVGRVVEVAEDVTAPAIGDVVHGIWGHRSEAVLPASALSWRVMPEGSDPLSGIFARVGSIALNAVLAADVRLGEHVAVFGQGVIGLLATRLAVLSGAQVIAVDALPLRLEASLAMGAREVVSVGVPGGAGAAIRSITGSGADSAIELSGSDAALHEAIRSVVVEGTVAASGFYQGGASALKLGHEFHHNRVRIVASQISGVPVELGRRWDQARLIEVFMAQTAADRVDTRSLVTDMVPAEDVASIFERLDRRDDTILQSVLRFDDAPEETL